MASRKNKAEDQGSLFAVAKEENRWDAPQYEFNEREFNEKYPTSRKFKPRRDTVKPIHQRIQEQENRAITWKAIHAKLAEDMGLNLHSSENPIHRNA